MSWRIVVISRRAKLDLKMNYLVVRDEEIHKVHLSEVSTVIIESTAVSLTTALLCELTKRKIKVLFCDEKRNPSSELVACYGSHDTSGRIRQQLQWTEKTKAIIWTEIVTEKIRKQAELLEKLGREEGEMLRRYASHVEIKDETNREGHAAKVYFNAMFGMDFTRASDNARNAALNYGYGILLSSFNREITGSGYITQLGLNHNNQFNQFNFSSDLMEPFRPLVDCVVYDMEPEAFTHQEKMNMVNILNCSINIDGKIQHVNNAIKIYCKSIFEALTENDISLIRFYKNEL